MPIVFTYRGIKFFFFSNEGTPREPIHIHVRNGVKLAKFWVEPAVALAESWGYSSTELSHIAHIVKNRKAEILEAWNEHFEP